MHFAARRVAGAGAASAALWYVAAAPQEDRRAQEEESCRKLGLMLPTEAQRTAVARIPGFLSARECDDVRDVVRGLKCATIERSAGGQHVFMGPWTTTYLHTDDQFRQRLGGLRSRLLAAAVAVDGRERWGQLDETADVNFRTAEYHQYQPGGGLRDARHYDAGSLITMDLMLAAPGADFEGGAFVTPEADGCVVAFLLVENAAPQVRREARVRQGRPRALRVPQVPQRA